MSKSHERTIEQLVTRVRDLENELRLLKEESPQSKRGFAEACLAGIDSGDGAAAALGSIVSGAQTITEAQATLLEVIDAAGTLKLVPIDNAAGTNKAKVKYLNAGTDVPPTRSQSSQPMLLLRLRDGRHIRVPSSGLSSHDSH